MNTASSVYKYTTPLFLLFAILAVVGVGCDKKKSKDTIELAEEVKAYLVFTPGSFWVYRDTVSGDLDTVVLDRAAPFARNNAGEPVNLQEYSIQYTSRKNGVKEYIIKAYTIGKSVYYETKTGYYRFHNELNIGKKIPELNGANFRGFLNNTDSIEGPIAVFKNEAAEQSEGNPVVIESYKKGVGLVTREYKDGKYEELIEYTLK